MKKSTKKIIYVFSFIVLGILLQFIIHAGLEIWYIGLLNSDFVRYGMGFSWRDWFVIHYIFTVVFVILGIVFGYYGGAWGWKKVYNKNK